MTADNRFDFAVEVAMSAARTTLKLFGSAELGLEHKSDGSEVTRADRECEQFLRNRIAAAFPNDAILGEEFGETPGTSGWRWILDPIDGTTSFVHGVPLFGTLVGVEHEGEIEIGVIAMPVLDEIVYAARGCGAWHRVGDGEPVPARVSTTKTLAEAMVLTTSPDYFRGSGTVAVFDAVTAAAGHTRGWSDCYGFVLAATGRADAVVEPALKLWDAAPMPVIFAEAGGRYSDWTGKPDPSAPTCIASNGLIHDELLELIGSVAV